MRKHKLLIFTINPVHNAPRVIREIECLKEHFEIVVTGETPPKENSVEFISAEKIKFSHLEYTLGKIFRAITFGIVFKGKYPTTQRKIDSLLNKVKPDLVIVHPGAFLPYFFGRKQKFKVVFHAHEYHPKEFEGDLRWKNTWGKIYQEIYKSCLPKVDLLINVCEGIAKECKTQFGKDSLVIPNAGPYRNSISPTLRDSGKVRMIHHGVAIKERKLELMIELSQALGEGFELDLMLVYQDENYYSYLKKLASQTNNVRLISPVSFGEIVDFIHQYDIGLFLLPPVNFNYLHALPNKFFEFVQARLAIAVGPSPEMASLVREYELGVVSEDFSVESLRKSLQNLTHDSINSFKMASDRAAIELCSEQYNQKFTQAIIKLIS